MISMGSALLFFGVTGFIGSTFGSPGLAWTIARLSSGKGEERAPKPSDLSLDIIIAARNEERQIIQTLESVARESRNLAREFPARVRIWVGLDHCTDETEALALEWFKTNRAEGGVIKNPDAPGKWNNLEHSVSKSDADWVALVDVGAVWESADSFF